MPVLVTGMSGTGKSSALAELARRGFRTVDTDLDGWSVFDEAGDEWLWDEARIAALLDDAGAEPLFVSGTVRNQVRFYDRFDAVVLLSAPLDVILERIDTRTGNDWGKTPEQRALVAAQVAEIEPLLRRGCTHEVDATRPLGEVVDALAALGVKSAFAGTVLPRCSKYSS